MIELKHTKPTLNVIYSTEWPFRIYISNGEENIYSFNRPAYSTAQNTIEDCENAVGFPEEEKQGIVNLILNQKADINLFASAPELIENVIKDYKEIGKWLSAALEDKNVCDEMKRDINAWFNRFKTFEKATGYKISEVIE